MGKSKFKNWYVLVAFVKQLDKHGKMVHSILYVACQRINILNSVSRYKKFLDYF